MPYPRATFWDRVGASLIDAVLFAAISGATHIVFLGFGGWAIYQVGMWSWKQTTIGGIVLGIKGERMDGRPMDFGVALIRYLASCLSSFALGLGYLWAAWDSEGQTWHDKIAGTVVVKVPKNEPLL